MITDLATGKVTEYNLGNARTKVGMDEYGNKVYDSTIIVGDTPSTSTTQNNSDTFGGWKGTVEIIYTDDGMFSCLTRSYVEWDKVSGSNTCTNVSLTYGQDLGTDSEVKEINLRDTTGIGGSTGFKAGKYGVAAEIQIPAQRSVCNPHIINQNQLTNSLTSYIVIQN